MLTARKLNPPMSGIQLGPVTRTFINTPGAVNGFISAPKRLRMFIIGQVLGLPLTATKTEVSLCTYNHLRADLYELC
jgi:hypothetical protein